MEHPIRAAWNRHGPVWVGFIILSCLFYTPVLVGARTFPDGDFVHHFFPFILFQQQELLAGQFPIWNPYTFAGHPFLADIQSAVFYPISTGLLLLTLPVTNAATRLYLLQVEAIVHIVIAGAGAYLFVRRISDSRFAGLMAGICFAFSGYLTGYPTTQLAVIRTAVWLPLILFSLDHAFVSPYAKRWWLAAGSLGAVAFFGGHAQTMLYIVYVTFAWILLEMALGRYIDGRVAPSMAHVAGLVVMVLSAIGIAAVQLIPALEFASRSVRAHVDYAFVSGGLPLEDTWQLVLPGVFTWYSPIYIGVPGLLMAAVSLVGLRRRAGDKDRPAPNTRLPAPIWWVSFFATLAALAMLVSYGDHSFLYRLFYKYLPGWGLFRGQERAAYIVAFSVSVLAGIGAARLRNTSIRWRKRFALSAGALVVAVVYGFGLGWQLLGKTAIGNMHYIVVASMTIVSAMVVALLIWLPGWSRRRSELLLFVAVLNLFVVNFSTSSAPGTPGERAQVAPEIVALVDTVADGVQNRGDTGRIFNEYRVYEDYGMRTKLDDVGGSSPLKLATYARFLAEFPLDRLWRLIGVQYVLTWRKELFVPSTLLGEFPQEDDVTYLHRLSNAHPRAWIVSELWPQSDEDAYVTLADHQVDLDLVATVEEEFSEFSWPRGENKTSIVRVSSNRIHVETQSEEGGLLVVAENWMPGWRVRNLICENDARAVAMCRPVGYEYDSLALLQPMRTNLSLIGLHVPPGSLALDLVYLPNSLLIGAALSISAILGIIILIVVHRRMSATREPGSADVAPLRRSKQ